MRSQEIMDLIVSVCSSVLSRLNCLIYDLDFWQGGSPWLEAYIAGIDIGSRTLLLECTT